jgi:hypothetical protein
MNPIRRSATPIFTTLVLLLTVAVAPTFAKKEPIEKYKANALAVGGPVGSQSTTLSINIYEWSDEDDREMVVDAIKEATENKRAYRAVPDTLRKLGKAGYMFLAGGQGWPIRYAQAFEVDGKREIVLAMDRPVTFSEVYSGSAVRDFDITLIVLKFDKDASTGEGIASVGTEIKWNEAKGQLEITSFSSQPVRLGDVRAVE